MVYDAKTRWQLSKERLKRLTLVRKMLKQHMDSRRKLIDNEYLKSVDSRHIQEMKNIYEGNRCFIIGNGPSLTCEDRSFLDGRGVQAQMHYPIPPHRAKCYEDRGYGKIRLPMAESFADRELSLPIYAGMSDDEVESVIAAVNDFR